ncbi:hypothetical protein SAMN02799620_00791 [Mycolicibacterium fluoranthenivorans]|uniref:DUF3168 domain-containing protein n=1 Tax=Mycolicibacterium fluoranthenivorans TaxID=258505 RepID=A0A1G4VFI7_9MYCO|nr:hypothetical protein SAMN02799620_00791 [Mycolicibacterium fluoranthenivorans]
MIPDYVRGVKDALRAAPTPFDATLEVPATFDVVAGTPVVLVADDGGPAVLSGAWMAKATPYLTVLRLTSYATGRTVARQTVVDAVEFVVANKPGIARIESVSVPLITKDKETGAMLASITVPVIVRQTA